MSRVTSISTGKTYGLARVCHAGRPIARHALLAGTRQRSIDPAHFDGLVGRTGKPGKREESLAQPQTDLARPLSEYEALAGGGF